MKTKRLFFILVITFISSLFSFAQTGGKDKASQNPTKSNQQAVKSSPAYAELLLRRTELAAQVEDMQVDYTEDYPKLKESRYE
ncbi:MAG TPA: hypothetical protein VK892_14645, partial [Pyrinomonadaceae bacterium]|nr:hypothetical protein [Pyrinomonadaceae bacterium]